MWMFSFLTQFLVYVESVEMKSKSYFWLLALHANEAVIYFTALHTTY
jgi:hypothetical protein